MTYWFVSFRLFYSIGYLLILDYVNLSRSIDLSKKIFPGKCLSAVSPSPSPACVPKLDNDDQDAQSNPIGNIQKQTNEAQTSNNINVIPIVNSPENMSYEKALKTMPLPENREEVQVLKIPVPLRASNFKSKEGLDLAFRKVCSAILKRVPIFCQNEVTLSKTFTALGGRNIHTITVVESSAAKPYFDEIRTKGIELLDKTVFPLGHSAFSSSNRHNMYPRKVNIKIQNLPFICSDDEAMKLFNLPPQVENIDEIVRRKENVEGVDFYTGEAQVKVGVWNERQLKNLTRWSYDNRTKNEPTLWNGIPVSFHAPSLHMCEDCKKQNKRFQGHHKDWCFLARRERLQKLAKMTATTPQQTQIHVVESQEESQDEAQDITQDESQDESQDHKESQNESQEESQDESQDESQIEAEEETLAEGSVMTAHADNNTTKNQMKNDEKPRYVPPEERCRRAAERENDEEDTRRLSLSNFPPLSNSRERNRMFNKQRNKKRVTSPGSAAGNSKTKAAKAGGSPNKWKP